MIVPPSYRLLLCVLLTLAFCILLFLSGASLGFAADIELYSLSRIIIRAVLLVLAPAIVAISICQRLAPGFLLWCATFILFAGPLGFYIGAQPTDPSPSQLLAATIPVLTGGYLLVLYLELFKNRK